MVDNKNYSCIDDMLPVTRERVFKLIHTDSGDEIARDSSEGYLDKLGKDFFGDSSHYEIVEVDDDEEGDLPY